MAVKPKNLVTTKSSDFRRTNIADHPVTFSRPLPYVSDDEIEFLLRILADEIEHFVGQLKFGSVNDD